MTLPDRTTAPPWWERIGYEPTNLEVADWLARTSDANRDAWFDRMRDSARQAGRCFEFGHETALENLTCQLREARERIAWLEKHYAAEDPA